MFCFVGICVFFSVIGLVTPELFLVSVFNLWKVGHFDELVEAIRDKI
jgi:hypothetical protein